MFNFSLPTTYDDAYQTIVLSGTSYRFRIRWNSFSECWYFHLATTGSTAWKCKVKMTTNTDLLKQFRAYDWCPKGVLLVYDDYDGSGRVDRENFNGIDTRFRIMYIPEEEFIQS